MTDLGNVRSANEDCFLVDPGLGLLVVADGMSGHGGGAVASALAAKSIHAYLSSGGRSGAAAPAVSDETILGDDVGGPPPASIATAGHTGSPVDRVREALAYANNQVYAVNRAHGMPERKGIGTTLAGLYWPAPSDSRAIVFHVGDCRVNRLRDSVFRHLSQDHSAFQRWIDDGAKGAPPAHNVVLRAVGPSASVEADVVTCVLLPGDVFLLCSDGLTGMVPDRELRAAMLQTAAGASVEDIALRLIALAKANGGKDNVTVALGIVR
ncbi:MAG: serine/threonine-protein phosphatase [Alphaproteobacteria bacterium]|nr:serine/threonine-protein phosphatase [Alphaproteobacteria bacterium]